MTNDQKTYGKSTHVNFRPFNDTPYHSSCRSEREFSIRQKFRFNEDRATSWLIPTHLINPFNMRVQQTFDGTKVYRFRDAEGIIRVDHPDLSVGYGICGIGKNNTIHRVVVDKTPGGYRTYSLEQGKITEEEYKGNYTNLQYMHHDVKVTRQVLDKSIDCFGFLKELFKQHDNDLSLNIALRVKLSSPQIYVRGAKFANYGHDGVTATRIYAAADSLVTLKFKNGDIANATVQQFISGYQVNRRNLSGVFKLHQDEMNLIYGNDVQPFDYDLNSEQLQDLEWIAILNFNECVSVEVLHGYTDKEDILKMFDPIYRNDVKVDITMDTIGDAKGADACFKANQLISEQLLVDHINVIYINNELVGIEESWDGNQDSPAGVLNQWCVGRYKGLPSELAIALSGDFPLVAAEDEPY